MDDEDVGISSVSFGATLSKSSLRGDASERVKTPDNYLAVSTTT